MKSAKLIAAKEEEEEDDEEEEDASGNEFSKLRLEPLKREPEVYTIKEGMSAVPEMLIKRFLEASPSRLIILKFVCN